MGTTVKPEMEFSNDFLFDFSERFDAVRREYPRLDLKIIFVYACRELRIFGKRADKLFDAFMTYRSTVRVPEKIMEKARFLPVEEPPQPKMSPVPIKPVHVKKVSSLPKIKVKGDRGPDRHELQLPRGERPDSD